MFARNSLKSFSLSSRNVDTIRPSLIAFRFVNPPSRRNDEGNTEISIARIHVLSTTCHSMDVVQPRHQLAYRNFSSGSPPPNESTSSTDVSVDETLSKLFDEQQQQLSADAVGAASNAWYQTATQTAADWSPTWYNVADQSIVAINTMHDYLGVEYGWSIVATTVFLRLGLFPLMVAAQRTTSRMAHMSPELNALKDRYEKLGTPTRQEQLAFAKNVKALFERYDVKPARAFIAPIIQIPIFVGMFFGLKKMPGIFPETLSDGGMFWFPDLSIPDPYYILPILSATTLFGLIEIGKEQMLLQNKSQGAVFINFFRIMAVLSLPVVIQFEAAMLCYWVSNNSLTIIQTLILKQKVVRKTFGIWEMPKPVPGQEDMSSMSSMLKRIQGEALTEEERIKKHNEQVEAERVSTRTKKAARVRARKGITGRRV